METLTPTEAVLAEVKAGTYVPGEWAHYVIKDAILPAWASHKAIQALCGLVYVPKQFPTEKPTCTTCKALYDNPCKKHDRPVCSECKHPF